MIQQRTTQTNLLIVSAIITMALPIVLVLTEKLSGNPAILNSISSYYHSGSRDIFVGALFAVGVILFIFQGESTKENLVLDAAGLFAIVTALVPTNPDDVVCEFACSNGITPYCIHTIAAFAFFTCLAYITFFCFRKQCQEHQHDEKRQAFYEKTFAILAGLLLLLPILTILFASGIIGQGCSKLVFWLEVLAIYTLGCLWITKYYEGRKID